MTMNGQPAELHRPIPTLARAATVYARAPKACAPAPGPRVTGTPAQLYAISGVLGVHTAEGSFARRSGRSGFRRSWNTRWSTRAEMRSLYIRGDACAWAPTRCRVLEVPLAREPDQEFLRVAGGLPGGRQRRIALVQVLLDQLRLLPEVAFPADAARAAPAAAVPGTDRRTDPEPTMGDWAQRLGTSETLSRLFQRETGMNYRLAPTPAPARLARWRPATASPAPPWTAATTRPRPTSPPSRDSSASLPANCSVSAEPGEAQRGSEHVDGVVDDHPVFVDVVVHRAGRGAAVAQRRRSERFLAGPPWTTYLQVEVAFPVLGVLAVGAVPAAVAGAVRIDPGQVQLAARVRGRGAQAGRPRATKS